MWFFCAHCKGYKGHRNSNYFERRANECFVCETWLCTCLKLIMNSEGKITYAIASNWFVFRFIEIWLFFLLNVISKIYHLPIISNYDTIASLLYSLDLFRTLFLIKFLQTDFTELIFLRKFSFVVHFIYMTFFLSCLESFLHSRKKTSLLKFHTFGHFFMIYYYYNLLNVYLFGWFNKTTFLWYDELSNEMIEKKKFLQFLACFVIDLNLILSHQHWLFQIIEFCTYKCCIQMKTGKYAIFQLI